MPSPGKPPTVTFTSAVVSALQDQQASYNSTNGGFDLQQTEYYLILERGSSETTAQLTYGEESDASTYNSPIAKFDQTTWRVMHDGSYSSSTNRFTYQQDSYLVWLEEQNGVLQSVAVKE